MDAKTYRDTGFRRRQRGSRQLEVGQQRRLIEFDTRHLEEARPAQQELYIAFRKTDRNRQSAASLKDVDFDRMHPPLVCKKPPGTSRPGWDKDVMEEMRSNIAVRLRDFWDAGIRGPDFVWAATGPALEAYSKHPVVRKANEANATMSVGEFLTHVRRMVVDLPLADARLDSAPDSLLALANLFPLSWSQYVRLMSVGKPHARAFYEAESIRGTRLSSFGKTCCRVNCPCTCSQRTCAR